MSSEGAMVALTTISVVVATIATWVAAKARQSASESVGEAHRANMIAGEANRLSGEANEIAKEAADQAKAAPTDVAWDEVLAAIGMLQTADVASNEERFDKLLANLRVRVMLLVDRLPWDGFGEWAMREGRFGLLLMREAAEQGNRQKPLTVDQTLALNSRFHAWVAAYTINLRRFRAIGPDTTTFRRLAERAETSANETASRNGWEPLDDQIPGLSPLDPGD